MSADACGLMHFYVITGAFRTCVICNRCIGSMWDRCAMLDCKSTWKHAYLNKRQSVSAHTSSWLHTSKPQVKSSDQSAWMRQSRINVLQQLWTSSYAQQQHISLVECHSGLCLSPCPVQLKRTNILTCFCHDQTQYKLQTHSKPPY